MTTDLRLVGAAVGAWLTALGCLYGTVRVDLAAGAGLAALALVVGWARRLGVARWIAVAMLLGALCAAAITTARVAVRDGQPLAGLVRDHATVTVRLRVADDPHPVRGLAGRPASYAIPATVDTIRADGPTIDVHVGVLVLASDPAWRDLLPGTDLMASGRLRPARGGDLTAAMLDTHLPPDAVGTAPWPQRAAGGLRAGLHRACAALPSGPGGLLPGLVDGDTSRLDPAVADDFRATGMTHLVAVSGANVAIVIGAVLLIARWSRAGPVLAAGLCAVALVGFVILVRPSPSVLRAAVMGGIGLVALAVDRPRAALPALAGSVLLLLLLDPALAGSIGFALSVLATGGLLLLAPPLRNMLRRTRMPGPVAEALAIPMAAQIACAPVIAGVSGTLSLVAVPANLLAEPVVAPATILGVLATVTSAVWPTGAAFLAWLGSWPARWLVGVARHGADLPASVIAWPAGIGGALLLVVLLVVVLLVTRRPMPRLVAVICAIATAVGAVPVGLVAAGWPPAGALLVVCDVGQGDALVLPAAAGAAVVIDAGPEPTATDRCLRELGIHTVLLLVISHFHADHVGGIEGVYRGRRVEAVVTTSYAAPAAGHALVVAAVRARGTPLYAVGSGWSWHQGPLRLVALGPVDELTGTDSDPNNNSLVLAVESGGVRLLLAGDAEVQEQAAILTAYGASGLRADVLKVAHHGSAYQDEAFLRAVHPAVALVSVGVGNLYGHPNPGLLDRLRRDGARVLRTDRDGDVAAVGTSGHLATVRHGLPPGRHPP